MSSLLYEGLCVFGLIKVGAFLDVDSFCLVALLPCFAVVHQLYPFKTVERSHVVSGFIWGALAILFTVWVLAQFSNIVDWS